MNAFKRTFSFINDHPLAKQHLIRSYYRFILWQIRSRLYTNLLTVPFIGETKIKAKKGLTGITGSIYTGLHEFEDMSFMLHFLKENECFMDVGANVGAYTILASGVNRAKTISFEPIPVTFDIMKQNVVLNNLEELVTLKNEGIGSENGILNFTNSNDTTNHVAIDNMADSTISVPITTLDKYYEQGFKPSLIKIDVEGFETEVIKGAQLLLKDPILKAIIIELNGCGERYGYDDTHIHETLLKADFRPYNYQPFLRNLILQNSPGNMNTIYIRDIDYVKERILNAKPFKALNQLI